MTPHSTFVRSLLLLGWKGTATSKGAWDVTTLAGRRRVAGLKQANPASGGRSVTRVSLCASRLRARLVCDNLTRCDLGWVRHQGK